MRDSPKADTERTSRAGIAALAAIGVALLAAGAVATYQASLARAHAVREVVPSSPERPPDALQYLPGSSSQIGTLPEPLMAARRAALRAGFDGDDAPIDAFDRLQSVSGHEEEARTLLAQFWERKAMLADNPVHRVLYALQARVVDDDESRRREVASAIAALGPLRRARHVAEGTILWSDARTLVLRGSGWLHILNLDTETSFDLAQSDAASALVDAHRMVTWGDAMARVWRLDAAPAAPAASFRLLAGEVPLSFSGGCVLTSAGRVWREAAGAEQVADARRRWVAGSINPTCDRVVLTDHGIEAVRRRGRTWTAEPFRAPGNRRKGPSGSKSGEIRVEVCAAQAPRCVLRDGAGFDSVWDFGSSPPRQLYDGVRCEGKRFSPDGTRLMCRESQGRVLLYREDEAGTWTRTETVLPDLTGVFFRDDGTICGSLPSKDTAAIDRSDVLFFAAQACWAPAAVEPEWGSIRMQPTGTGAIFTYPATGPGASRNTEFFGFDSQGESLAAASNAWFGQRKDERLLEHDATNSAGERSYELAGAPFDPALALGGPGDASSVQIDQAFFVESPPPSLIVEMSYARRSPSPGPPLRAVARWDLRGKHFCGPAQPGGITGLAPTGDAVVIGSRVYRIGGCGSGRAFEPTGVIGVGAVGPGALRWISRERESLLLQGMQREPSVVPRSEDGVEAQIAFNREGDRFFVRTARSLCNWMIREDGALDLDGCRWSTGGWASDAAWAAADKTGETVIVFDRTAEGAGLREFFGSREADGPPEASGDLACDAPPKPNESPLGALLRWEERLGHRFKDQATQLQDAREMVSSEVVPTDTRLR